MSQCVEVRHACAAPHPQPLLPCGFETGIVALTLCLQSIGSIKMETTAVHGESVVIGNGLVFRATPVFLPVVPILVTAETRACLGLTEWAAVFLAVCPLSVVFPSLCMASPASQIGLPAESTFESFVPRGLRGINVSPA